MSVIPADIPMDENMATALIRRDFPELELFSICLLGEGWDNTVYLVDDKWVFRFPRRAVGAPPLENEIRILSAIADSLTLEVPRPCFIGRPSALFSWPYYGHAMIPGATGCKAKLSHTEYEQAAKDLGQELRRLHNLDFKKVIPGEDIVPHFDRTKFPWMLKNFKERMGQVQVDHELSSYTDAMNVIIDEAAKYSLGNTRLSLVHGDLYHRHLIFDENNRLTGVIDWGDSGVTDPVVDLGVIYQFFPPDVHEAFFEAYGSVSDAKKAYARFLGLYYAITLLWYGTSRNDTSLISSSMTSLSYL